MNAEPSGSAFEVVEIMMDDDEDEASSVSKGEPSWINLTLFAEDQKSGARNNM